jgi:hypothetical protein
MTTGERRFAERLEARLEPDYLLWYDVPVGPRARHPDFIIVHPRRGALMLEVKDWRTDTIQSINPEQATLLTERGVVIELNPFEQARQLAHEVVSLLQRDQLLVNPENDPRRGKLCLPWSYGVVLPVITRKQFVDAELGGAIPEDRVICADEMYEEVNAEEFQKRLWHMFPWWPKTPLSLPQIERIRWHLFPDIRVAAPRQTTLLPDAVPDVMRVMDLEQERLARSLGEGHRVIHGVAGSGKTMILVYRCVHLAKLVHKPVLVLCYNKTLAERLRQLINDQGVGQHVHVRNFHGWCRDQLTQYHCVVPTTTDKNEYAKQLVERLGDSVERGQVPAAQYGAVLVDEGHDFEAEWLKLVVRMVDPETDFLLLLYDDAQSIYKRRGKFSFRSVGVNAQGRTTILRLNYRNTAEVLKVAHKFAADVLKPEDADEDGVPIIQPQAADRHGPEPQLVRRATLRDEAAYLVRLFSALKAQNHAWGDMAVVYHAGFIAEEIKAAFERAGIPTVNLTARAPEKGATRPDKVSLVTFHSSKGLEYPVVAIPGLGFLPNPNEPEPDQVRRTYVAMTRPTERLIVTCHRESAFVKRLLAAGVQAD